VQVQEYEEKDATPIQVLQVLRIRTLSARGVAKILYGEIHSSGVGCVNRSLLTLVHQDFVRSYSSGGVTFYEVARKGRRGRIFLPGSCGKG